MRMLTTIAFVLIATAGPITRCTGADLAPAEVRAAMDRGIRYLKGSQHDNGNWSEYPGQPGGIACLVTLALLNAGVEKDEEHLKKALAYIRQLHPDSTYVVSLQTMVFCKADPKEDQDRIANNVEWLERAQIKAPNALRPGAWTYNQGSNAGLGDGSNSQFALLALYEAQRLVEADTIKLHINMDTWKRSHQLWKNWQREDGAWGYYDRMVPTGSMTCAGIASLIISNDVVHQPDARINGDTIDACYRDPKNDDSERVERGIEWLRRHFHIDYNPPNDHGLWHLYYLYALERTGRLTARRKIGEHDWYREGTAYLVRQNAPDTLRDSWQGSGHAEENEDIGTSLALLFLAKGRRPVLVAKIKHGIHEDDWNRRRNDINNLTIYVEGKWKHDLTWQVIDIKDATVDDLLQVPVLYYAGGLNPLPDDDEEVRKLAQKLRDYVDHGGFIFAEADCCTQGFDRGFRQLMTLVFPEEEYRLKPLDPSHPIWRFEQPLPPEQVRPLLGIDYGCRTSVVYAPAEPVGDPRPSLSCLWELSRGNQRSKSKVVDDQIDGGLTIGVNVLGYATNREVKDKFDVPSTVIVEHKKDPVERDKIYVAKLRHPGGCDTAPRALANLMETAAQKLSLRADVHPKLIGMEDEALFDFPLVFMHGRNAFHLTANERAALKKYVDRGGMIFADSICASEVFTRSFREEMAIIFPKNAIQPIAPRDPIWTSKYGGFDIPLVGRHDPQTGSDGGPLKAVLHRVPPELEGIKFGDRYGVIFSSFDLSCALEKQDSVECRGYAREDAARIGINVLVYALQH
jgi:hypothetical protein